MAANDFQSFLTDFFENCPLYVERDFPFPTHGHLSLQLTELNDVCEECGERRPFLCTQRDATEIKVSDGYGILSRQFLCVSCRTSTRRIYVRYEVAQSAGQLLLQKIGEWPRKKINRDKNLQRFFKDDLDNFEKATVCLANGYGVAAFAYFRRILEGNIVQLLELVREDAKASGAQKEVLDAIDELEKPGVPMSKKIEIANQAMPPYLIPDGLNPLGRLYANLSDGVHSAPEEECFKRANAIQFCLAYLVSELASRKRHRESFKKQLASL